jgi:hypothetical protein
VRRRHHPTKNNTTAIRLALRHGVASGTLKKNKASYLVAAGVATKKKSRSKKAAAAATTTSASGGADGAAAAAAAASTSTKKASGSSKRKAASAAPPKAAAPAKRVAAAIKKAASTSRSRGAAAAAGGSKATVFDTSTKAPKAEGIMWQYHHGVWKDYKSEASDVVERAYQEWKSNPYTDVRSIKSGDWEYQVRECRRCRCRANALCRLTSPTCAKRTFNTMRTLSATSADMSLAPSDSNHLVAHD